MCTFRPVVGTRGSEQKLRPAGPGSWLSAPAASRIVANSVTLTADKAPRPARLQPGLIVLISWACQHCVHTYSWPGLCEPTPALGFLLPVYSQALATVPRPGPSHLEMTPGSQACSCRIRKDSLLRTWTGSSVLEIFCPQGCSGPYLQTGLCGILIVQGGTEASWPFLRQPARPGLWSWPRKDLAMSKTLLVVITREGVLPASSG